MKRLELKKLIKEEILKESMGNGIRNTFSDLKERTIEVIENDYVDKQTGDKLLKGLDNLYELYKKLLKKKGLIGF